MDDDGQVVAAWFVHAAHLDNLPSFLAGVGGRTMAGGESRIKLRIAPRWCTITIPHDHMAPSFAHRVVAIGGEIEFGESWQAALVRKFHEELGIGISIVKAMS